jgi:hypothetical protein
MRPPESFITEALLYERRATFDLLLRDLLDVNSVFITSLFDFLDFNPTWALCPFVWLHIACIARYTQSAASLFIRSPNLFDSFDCFDVFRFNISDF